MFDTFVHVAFWSVYGFLTLGALVFVAGTLIVNGQIGTARHHFDEGSEDPRSNRLYEISQASGVYALLSWIIAMPLVVGAVLAFVGTGIGHSALAILISGAMLAAADAVRTRHDRLEREFEGLTGEPVRDTYHKVIGHRAPDRPAHLN